MGALKDIWNSERGVVACLLIIGCTVLVALGRFTSDQWLDYTKWIFAAYAGTKMVTAFAPQKSATKDLGLDAGYVPTGHVGVRPLTRGLHPRMPVYGSSYPDAGFEPPFAPPGFPVGRGTLHPDSLDADHHGNEVNDLSNLHPPAPWDVLGG